MLVDFQDFIVIQSLFAEETQPEKTDEVLYSLKMEWNLKRICLWKVFLDSNRFSSSICFPKFMDPFLDSMD